jgi:hypothetical protein
MWPVGRLRFSFLDLPDQSRPFPRKSAEHFNSPERTFQSDLLPHRLVARNDGTKESEEDDRQHQLAPGACDEVW